jgi:hypothetical protein
MFSVQQKRDIATAVQNILHNTHHPELPHGEIAFTLAVEGATRASWAHIHNNGAVPHPDVNPHNEMMALVEEEQTEEQRIIAAMRDLLGGIRFAMDQANKFEGRVDWTQMIAAIDQVVNDPLTPVGPPQEERA